jgi:hypothetical protein
MHRQHQSWPVGQTRQTVRKRALLRASNFSALFNAVLACSIAPVVTMLRCRSAAALTELLSPINLSSSCSKSFRPPAILPPLNRARKAFSANLVRADVDEPSSRSIPAINSSIVLCQAGRRMLLILCQYRRGFHSVRLPDMDYGRLKGRGLLPINMVRQHLWRPSLPQSPQRRPLRRHSFFLLYPTLCVRD